MVSSKKKKGGGQGLSTPTFVFTLNNAEYLSLCSLLHFLATKTITTHMGKPKTFLECRTVSNTKVHC